MQRRDFIGRNFAFALSGAALASALTPGPGKAQTASAEKTRVSRPGGGALRIGLIELDTSHADGLAQAIAGIEGVELTAIINRGLVYGKERTQKFAADFKVKHVCDTLEQMVPLVDVAFSIGVNWDNHVSDAEPFIKAGVPVFIDKPVVGSEAEARRLLELVTRYKTPVFGGSTYRYQLPQPVRYAGPDLLRDPRDRADGGADGAGRAQRQLPGFPPQAAPDPCPLR